MKYKGLFISSLAGFLFIGASQALAWSFYDFIGWPKLSAEEPVLGAVSVLKGQQGGTGIASTTAGNVGNCLSVSTNDPITYTFSGCSGGAGGGSGNLQADFPLVRTYGNATTTNIVFDAGFNSRASSTVSALLTIQAASTTSFSASDRIWIAGEGTSTFIGGVTANGLNITTGLVVQAGSVRIPLANCNTIDSDGNGTLFCGTDEGGAGSITGGGGVNALTYWDGKSSINATSTPTAANFFATSTLVASAFPIASSTSFSVADGLNVGGRFILGADTVTDIDAAGLTITSGGLAVGAGTCVTVNANDVAVTSNCTDAATVDSIEGASFLRSDASDTFSLATGVLDLTKGAKLGVGTDTPAAALGVFGEAFISGRLTLNNFLATSTTMFSGIGTTSPSNLFSVGGLALYGSAGGTSTNIGNALVGGTLQVKGLGGSSTRSLCVLADGSISASGCPSGGATTPGGASGDIQYNDGASGFGAEANFNWDFTNNILTVATTTSGSWDGIGTEPLLFIRATSTDSIDYIDFVRIGIGTTSQIFASSTNQSGSQVDGSLLRDQFVLDGRFYSTWRTAKCEGIGGTNENGTMAIPGCGDWMIFIEGASGTRTGTSSPGFMRITGSDSSPANTEGASLVIGFSGNSSTGGMFAASSTPVIEAWVRVSSNPNVLYRNMVGFITGNGDTNGEPTQGAWFQSVGTASGSAWEAVLANRGTITRTQTGFIPCQTGCNDERSWTKTLKDFQKLRIEMSSTTVLYFINDKLVARMSTTTPGGGMYAYVGTGINTGASAIEETMLDVARAWVWWKNN